jgi:hypothetical protein
LLVRSVGKSIELFFCRL